jgi:hypothetical protein
MRFRERFRELSRNGKTFTWDPREKAGQAAEEEVSADLLRRFHNTGWRLHRELRVPTGVGRRELDFVITSPNEAFVIELKNWSGRADIDRAGFVTQTRWPSNEVISHGCVLDTLRAKAIALKEYHHRHGEPARELRLRHYLVFWNPRLVMSHALARADGVVRWQQFERSLPPHRSILTSVLEALARFLGWTERAVSPPVDAIRALRTTLDQLGTWDWLHLHGGRCIRGDVLEAPRSSILRAPYDRERVRSIDFRIDRAWILGLVRAPRGLAMLSLRDERTAEEPIGFAETFRFQAAGSPASELFEARHLERLQYGYLRRA